MSKLLGLHKGGPKQIFCTQNRAKIKRPSKGGYQARQLGAGLTLVHPLLFVFCNTKYREACSPQRLFKEHVTYEHITNMPYLTQVIYEALRIAPPAVRLAALLSVISSYASV